MLRSGCKTRAVRLLFGPTPPGLKSNHVLGFTSLVFWLKLPQPPSQCLIREGKKPKKGQQKRRKCLGKGDHVSLGEYHEEDLNSGWIARRVWPEAIWGVVTSAVTGLAEPTQNVLRKLSSDSFIYFLFKQLCCGVDVKQGPCVYSFIYIYNMDT